MSRCSIGFRTPKPYSYVNFRFGSRTKLDFCTVIVCLSVWPTYLCSHPKSRGKHLIRKHQLSTGELCNRINLRYKDGNQMAKRFRFGWFLSWMILVDGKHWQFCYQYWIFRDYSEIFLRPIFHLLCPLPSSAPLVGAFLIWGTAPVHSIFMLALPEN